MNILRKRQKAQPAGCAFLVTGQRLHGNQQAGFTLIELVVVILLLIIISTVAMPKFFSTSPFQERGFSDSSLAAIRFARKLSVTSGCDTQVVFSPTGYVLNQRDGGNCKGANFSVAVQLPGSGSFVGSVPDGVVVSSANFYFDGSGRPKDNTGVLLTAVTSVSIGSRSLLIEPETGFAHQ